MPAAEVGPLRELLLLNRSQSKGKVKTANTGSDSKDFP